MKLLSGILIGALLASGVFYYFSQTSKEKERRDFIAGIDSVKVTSMNMNEPRPETDNDALIINSRGAITFLLSAENEIYYYKGIFNNTISKTDYSKVGGLIKKFNTEINADDLMFIIKSDQGASFKNAIDILDEMTINKIPPGHYAEIQITKEEMDAINIIKQTKNG